MEFYKLKEERFENGQLHRFEEYRCKMCKSILIRDGGQVPEPSEGISEFVEADINTV
jgi:hypothetical protein